MSMGLREAVAFGSFMLQLSADLQLRAFVDGAGFSISTCPLLLLWNASHSGTQVPSTQEGGLSACFHSSDGLRAP